MAVIGYIVSPGFKTPITDDDLLWAGRMIRGSAGSRSSGPVVAARLWVAATRDALLRKRGHNRRWPRFQDTFRNYSTAIHPGWQRDGAYCAPDSTHPRRHELCTEAKFRRRERVSKLTWAQMGSELKDSVYAWARGEVANPVPGAAHTGEWGDSDQPSGAWTIPGSGNWYGYDRESETLPVSIVPAGSSTLGTAGKAVIAALTAAGAYGLWRLFVRG